MAWLCRECYDLHLERSKDDDDLFSDDGGTRYYGCNDVGGYDDDDGDGDESDDSGGDKHITDHLKAGASSTLSESSEHGHVKCTDTIKETSADVKPDEESCLSRDDCGDGSIDSRYYVSSWENDEISTALQFAAQLGHEKCVDALIRAGADANEGQPSWFAGWGRTSQMSGFADQSRCRG